MTHTVEIDLKEGDAIVYLSDGIVEARDSRGQFVDLMKVTAPLAQAPLTEVLDDVLRALQGFTGGPLSDDLALMVAEYRGPAQSG